MPLNNNLIIFCGPMFASKSSGIIAKAKMAVEKGETILAFKPVIDNRYIAGDICTHDGVSFEKATGQKVILLETTNYLDKIYECCDGKRVDHIFFDEAQFFSDLSEAIEDLQTNLKPREIVCAGLDLDSFGDPFKEMPTLLAKATEVHKLKARCAVCSSANASRTFRKLGSSKEKIAIGGSSMYEARCYEHWIQGEQEKKKFVS